MVTGYPLTLTRNNNIGHSEAVYRKFLMDNRMELLHNVNESIKSIDDTLVKYESEAWKQYELLNVEAPMDREDDAIVTYRYTKISEIAEYLNEVTEDLYIRKTRLIQTRALLCKTIQNISENLQMYNYVNTDDNN